MRDKDGLGPEVGLMVNSFSQDAVKDETAQSVPVELDGLSQATMQCEAWSNGHLDEIYRTELLTQLKLRWMNSVKFWMKRLILN